MSDDEDERRHSRDKFRTERFDRERRRGGSDNDVSSGRDGRGPARGSRYRKRSRTPPGFRRNKRSRDHDDYRGGAMPPLPGQGHGYGGPPGGGGGGPWHDGPSPRRFEVSPHNRVPHLPPRLPLPLPTPMMMGPGVQPPGMALPPQQQPPPQPQRAAGPSPDETQPAACVVPYNIWLTQHPELASDPDVNAKYDDFKTAEVRRLLRTFFNLHKEEVWFKEKYQPGEELDARRAQRRELLARRVNVFNQFLEAGDFDGLTVGLKDQHKLAKLYEKINAALDDPDPAWEEKKVQLAAEAEAAAAAAKAAKEAADAEAAEAAEAAAAAEVEGDADPTPAGEDKVGEEGEETEGADATTEKETPETPADGDAAPTTTTTTTRAMDSSGADGEELLDFEEEQVEGAETSDAAPASTKDATDAEPEPEAEAGDDTDAAEPDRKPSGSSRRDQEPRRGKNRHNRRTASSCTLFVRSVPLSVGRTALFDALKDVPGFRRLAVSFPSSRSPTRMAWVTFSKAVDIGEARRQVDRMHVGSCTIRFTIAPSNESLIRMSQAALSKEDPALLKTLITKLDLERGLFDSSNPNPLLADATDDDAEDEGAVAKRVLYLRIVHSYDYYSGSEFPIEDDLTNRCCTVYVRLSDADRKARYAVQDWRERVQKRISVPAVTEEQAAEWGTNDAEGAIEAFVKSNSIQVKEGIFKCTLSNKFFKSLEFVKRHVLKQYADRAKLAQATEAFFGNYVRDPVRPFKNEAPPPMVQPQTMLSPPGMPGGFSRPPFPLTDEFGRALRPGVPPPVVGFRPPPFAVAQAQLRAQRPLPSYSDLDAPQGPPGF